MTEPLDTREAFRPSSPWWGAMASPVAIVVPRMNLGGNEMSEPKLPPRTLRVVIRDDSPMICCNDSPSYRSVAIELTDAQLEQVQLHWKGRSSGQDIYESVSMVFFD